MKKVPYNLPLPIPFTIGHKPKNELPTHRTRNREVKIQTIETIELLEIGYAILPAFWNQGFASESATIYKKPTSEERYAMINDRLDHQIAQKAEIKKILSEEQYKKWDQHQQRKNKHHNGKHHNGKRGDDGPSHHGKDK